MVVRTVKFGGSDFTPEPLPSKDLNDTFGFVSDTFLTATPSDSTADPTGQHKTTSATFTNIPGIFLPVAVTANVKVLLMLNLTTGNDVVGETTDVQIFRSATPSSNSHTIFSSQGASGDAYPTSVLWIDSPGTTTPTYKGRFRTTANGTAVASNIRLSAVELGK